MEDPIIGDKARELDPRDEAVLSFASSLLKRTLSESFVGVPLTDGCCSSTGDFLRFLWLNLIIYLRCFIKTGAAAENTSIQNYQNRKEKPILNPRSLSLELAKHKHRLAAQLVRVLVFDFLFWTFINALVELKNKLAVNICYRIDKFPQTQHEQNRSSLKTTPKQLKWSISEVQRDQTINCDDVVMNIKKTVRFQDKVKINQCWKERIWFGSLRIFRGCFIVLLFNTNGRLLGFRAMIPRGAVPHKI